MKKILFGSAAAICAVAGLSSFKTAKKSFVTTYYWHVIDGSGSKTVFLNADLDSYYGTTAPVSNPCTAGTVAKCVVGFTAAQLTGIGSNTILKTSTGAKQNRATSYKRTAI
jgi:hypothetical protein